MPGPDPQRPGWAQEGRGGSQLRPCGRTGRPLPAVLLLAMPTHGSSGAPGPGNPAAEGAVSGPREAGQHIKACPAVPQCRKEAGTHEGSGPPPGQGRV